MKFLDANIFIRYLARDDQGKTEACHALFERVRRGEEELATNEAVIAEVVYVLSSRSLYAVPAAEMRARLIPVMSLRRLRLNNKRACFRALDLFAMYPALDFEDALCVAHMERKGISQIYSYDRDFDRIPGIERLEP